MSKHIRWCVFGDNICHIEQQVLLQTKFSCSVADSQTVSCTKRQYQRQKKSDCQSASSSLSPQNNTVVLFFLFFSPNPVKLFLRADQCSHASVLQLINETLLILLLSALFIGLLLCLISTCLLLPPSSHSLLLSLLLHLFLLFLILLCPFLLLQGMDKIM